MRILICGDRDWDDILTMSNFFMLIPSNSVIIQGGCRGADLMAKRLAEDRKIIVIEVFADWARYGTDAGPIRNQLMIDAYKPDLVIAFHNNLRNSKGTKDMIHKARNAKIPCVLVCTPKGD